MRWQGREGSENVRDVRHQGGGRGVRVGGGIGLMSIVMGLIYLYMGADPGEVVGMLAQQSQQRSAPQGRQVTAESPEEQKTAKFLSVIKRDLEETWTRLFAEQGVRYRPAKLTFFRDAVPTHCGHTSAAVGPFYCPADESAYIDFAFYGELEHRFGAAGDFAQAYVIAHEIGHHVQNVLGMSEKVQRARSRAPKSQANDLSVRAELQADCYAGVWGHYAHQKNMLEPGDLEEGLQAAQAIGDDNIQRRTQGRVRPESWTHGSSEMRTKWFVKGLKSGKFLECDTGLGIQG